MLAIKWVVIQVFNTSMNKYSYLFLSGIQILLDIHIQYIFGHMVYSGLLVFYLFGHPVFRFLFIRSSGSGLMDQLV